MREYDATTAAHLATPGPRQTHILLWTQARRRGTGATETLGLWTGAQTEDFVVGGETRTYIGAGSLVGVPQLTRAIGLDVRLLTLTLVKSSPAIRQALAQYDTRHAPVELRRALFAPATSTLIAEPHIVFRGVIDQIDSTTAPIGGEAELPIKLAPRAQLLTRTLPARYSHETAQEVGDGIFRYAAVSGEPNWYWGRKQPNRSSSGNVLADVFG